MEEKEKQRIRISALQKRKALIEVSKNKKPKDILFKSTNDKKYANKLIHKWKKESFSKQLDLSRDSFGFNYIDLDIDYELKSFNFYKYSEAEIFLQAKEKYEIGDYIKSSKGFYIYSGFCTLYSFDK